MRPAQNGVSLLKTALLAILGAVALLKVLQLMGMGCASSLCSVSGFRLGWDLFSTGVALAVLGASVVSVSKRSATPAHAFPRLFTSLGIGLIVVVAYVYARSLINHEVRDLPISRAELAGLWLLITFTAVYLHWKRRISTESLGSGSLLLMDLMLLFLLCVVVADRELARVVNLSSDPDQHVFFALQIERFGAVPFHQREWGSLDFNYPAGSGVILFIWHQVTGLDLRNLVVALPVLFTYVAALVMVEGVARDVDRVAHRLVIQLAALALTAAALMFPLYKEYFHQEGTARQLSVLPAALFLSFVMAYFRPSGETLFERTVFPVLVIFTLTVLNPANVVVPAVVLSAMFVCGWVSGGRKAYLIGILLSALVMLLMEPYFQGVLGLLDRGPVEGLIYDDRFAIKTLPQVASGAWATWTVDAATLLREFAVLFAETRQPLFLTFFLLYLAALMVVYRRWRTERAIWWALAAFAVGLYVVFGFARSLLDDQRFFLLAPYIFFNMTQYKALLLIMMLAFVLRGVVRWPLGAVLAAVAAVPLIFPVMAKVRGEQDMYLPPRNNYCGAFGCLAESDFRLLKAFEDRVRSGQFRTINGVTPKVLLPNAPMRTEHESWILPVSSARVLPYFDVLPAAFYYYQGEPYYGTATYNARVCEQLDREWLRSRNIEYIYLPSDRDRACLSGKDQLIHTEEVVLRDGNAFLLKLR